MFKVKPFLALLNLAVLLLATNCKKEVTKPVLATQLKLSRYMDARNEKVLPSDSELELLARTLAGSLGDRSVRELIKQEVVKKIDGDYDILLQELDRKTIGKRSALTHIALSGSGTDDDTLLKNLIKRFPKLNILGVNPGKWDPATSIPLVAFISSRYNERESKTIKAFDSKGNVLLLDAQKKPEIPVLVLGINERIHIKADGSYELKQFASIMPDDDGNPGNDPGTDTGGCTTCSPCPQDQKNMYLKAMWMKNVGYYESWILGAPEIKYEVKSPWDSNSHTMALSIFEIQHTYSIEQSWYNASPFICSWNRYGFDNDEKSVNTDMVGFFWLELDDWGYDTLELTYDIHFEDYPGHYTSGVKSFIFWDVDDVIGFKTVRLGECPPNGYYTIGSGDGEFRFKIESR